VTLSNSLQEQAERLRELQEPGPALSPVHADAMSLRLESLLGALWRMTDDLALIRDEFRAHTCQERTGARGADGVVPPEGYRIDEVAGVIAQVDAVEHSIIAIVAVLTERDGSPPTAADTGEFLRRVEQQKREIFRKSDLALRQLRLQAMQLSAAVHAFRSGLALASTVIARARQ
jgi:hypothetical protein